MARFVDIHSHILWGLDDGARDYETSLEMLRMAAGNGTTDIVATPHSNLQYPFDPDKISARIHELDEAVAGNLASTPAAISTCTLTISTTASLIRISTPLTTNAT